MCKSKYFGFKIEISIHHLPVKRNKTKLSKIKLEDQINWAGENCVEKLL